MDYNRQAMGIRTIGFVLLPLMSVVAENATPQFDAAAADRFAQLALACVAKEYPNKISHVLNSDADVAPPRKLTPAFCGCYDWHSSVHGHWLLVRLVRTFPDASFADAAREALKKSLTAENLKQEAAYLRGTVVPLSNGRMGWRGSCNSALSYGSGMIHRQRRCPPICAHWKKQRWNDCRTGCLNCRIRSGLVSTIRLRLASA